MFSTYHIKEKEARKTNKQTTKRRGNLQKIKDGLYKKGRTLGITDSGNCSQDTKKS
jgi:hypothetical protein